VSTPESLKTKKRYAIRPLEKSHRVTNATNYPKIQGEKALL